MTGENIKRKSVRKGLFLWLLLAAVLSFAAPARTNAAAAAQTARTAAASGKKKGLIHTEKGWRFRRADGTYLRSRWKNTKGHRYYFKKNGYAAVGSYAVNGQYYIFNRYGMLKKPETDRVVEVDGEKYYVSAKGKALSGWVISRGKLYYAYSNGKCAVNETVDGVTFSAKGAAQTDQGYRLKCQLMDIVSRITTPSMSSSQKLRACWNYVVGGNIRYRSDYPSMVSGWQRSWALRTLENHAGNCYGYACAFAALAHEVGYESYVVCGRVSGSRDGAPDGMTRHAWVRINGGNYDPEGQYAGWLPGVYGSGGYPVRHSIQQIIRF